MGHRYVARCAVLLGLSLVALAAAAADAPVADATERMDRDTVITLIGQSADVNAPQVDGMTALHWATFHDDLDLVDTLLRAGADATAANRYGITPLSLACTNANVQMVNRLLDAGADPNETLPGGETVLMTAARTGRVGAVNALLVAGADVHATEDRRGQTAMMWGAAEGHVDVVEALLESGADYTTPLASGFTPFLFAVREGHIGVALTLLRAGVNVNATVEESVPRVAVAGGGRLRSGVSALHVAVMNAHYEMAGMLLDEGADPNASTPGYTVLHAVAKVRKPGGGDNSPSPPGSGTMRSLELVRKLAEQGADLNAQMTNRVNLNNTRFNEIGATPFMLAALTADAPLMRTLAKLGGDPLLRNADHSTPLMAAAGLGTRSPGEDAGTENAVLEAIAVALELGADVDAVDDNGETAMHGAAYKNLPRAVDLLAEHGASIEIWNQQNRFGWTPLTIARGYRFGNFKPSPVTVVAVEGVMLSAGVMPPTEEEEAAKSFDIYALKPEAPPAPRR